MSPPWRIDLTTHHTTSGHFITKVHHAINTNYEAQPLKITCLFAIHVFWIPVQQQLGKGNRLGYSMGEQQQIHHNHQAKYHAERCCGTTSCGNPAPRLPSLSYLPLVKLGIGERKEPMVVDADFTNLIRRFVKISHDSHLPVGIRSGIWDPVEVWNTG